MSRIAERFARLREEGRGALIPFLEAYDPDPATSAALLAGMPASGADLIEIGMPVHRPDGGRARSSRPPRKRALAAGATLAGTLAMVRAVPPRGRRHAGRAHGVPEPDPRPTARPGSAPTPASAGVDGLIVVDLPSEEADLLAAARAERHGLDVIRLVAPTTDDARLREGARTGSSGFVYYVSITGITGTRSATAADLRARPCRACGPRPPCRLRSASACVPRPRRPRRCSMADAAVVASALIETMSQHAGCRAAAPGRRPRWHAVLDQIRALAEAGSASARVPA